MKTITDAMEARWTERQLDTYLTEQDRLMVAAEYADEHLGFGWELLSQDPEERSLVSESDVR